MSNNEQTYYFVDVESTGVDLENDRIIQLAFLKEENEVSRKNLIK